jgi:hypothetical protein
MPSALGELIEQEDPVVGQRSLARQRHLAAADQVHIRDSVMGARHGRIVTTGVQAPVRPATRRIRGVDGLQKIIPGRVVVRH